MMRRHRRALPTPNFFLLSFRLSLDLRGAPTAPKWTTGTYSFW